MTHGRRCESASARLLLGCALAFCLAIVVAAPHDVTGAPTSRSIDEPPATSRVDDDVWDAARTTGHVPIIIALRQGRRSVGGGAVGGGAVGGGAVGGGTVGGDATGGTAVGGGAPGGGAAGDASTADQDRHIAVVQNLVLTELAGLPTGSFNVTHKYAHIPALGASADATAIQALASSDNVIAVSMDPVLVPTLADAAAFVGADRLRRSRVRGKGVGIAVLDTGVDTGNIDLRDAIVAEACFLTPESLCPDPPHVAEDADGHGTSVSALAVSRGKRSDHGIASEADLIAVKLIEERNNAAGTELLAALNWIIGRDDVHVINMSFASGAYEGTCDNANAYTRSLANATHRMHAKGIVPVASSGNDGSPSKMGAPACVEGVISVGAIQGHGPGGDPRLAQFTNRNNTLDLLAPGVGIATTTLSGRDTTFGGTSAAAPIVAGAVALLLGEVPWASPQQIEDALKATTARPTLRYGDITIGTIRVDKALTELRKIDPPATPSPTVVPTDPPTATATASPTVTAAPPTATRTMMAPSVTPSAPPSASSPPETSTPTASVTPVASSTTEQTTYAVWLPIARRP